MRFGERKMLNPKGEKNPVGQRGWRGKLKTKWGRVEREASRKKMPKQVRKRRFLSSSPMDSTRCCFCHKK